MNIGACIGIAAKLKHKLSHSPLMHRFKNIKNKNYSLNLKKCPFVVQKYSEPGPVELITKKPS